MAYAGVLILRSFFIKNDVAADAFVDADVDPVVFDFNFLDVLDCFRGLKIRFDGGPHWTHKFRCFLFTPLVVLCSLPEPIVNGDGEEEEEVEDDTVVANGCGRGGGGTPSDELLEERVKLVVEATDAEEDVKLFAVLAAPTTVENEDEDDFGGFPP